MLLQKIPVCALAELLRPHMELPAWPGLTDGAVKAAAREYAKASGQWELIDRTLDPDQPLTAFRHTIYKRHWKQSDRVDSAMGSPANKRLDGDALTKERDEQTQLAALALWLDHPKASLDYLQDLLWAWCESPWQSPSHDSFVKYLELISSTRARQLAEYRFVFADRLAPEVGARLSQELFTRALEHAHNPWRADPWQTLANNWNVVCNTNLIIAALYEIKDADALAAFIHPIIRRMDYALEYYTEDGGCVEGPGYWVYGFGHFIDAALCLRHRTGGALNLMASHPKLERCCRYPLAAWLRAPVLAGFADAVQGWLGAETALKVNRFFSFPELYELVEPGPGGLMPVKTMRGLALYRGEQPRPHTDRADHLLPVLGYAKAFAADPAAGDIILAVQAGSNGVSHSHNDLGSFIYMRNGVCLLTDPGCPVYSAKTFSPRRYEMLFCRSRGHSVPVVNGCEQGAGPEYTATITAENLNEPNAAKAVAVDLTHAYPVSDLVSLKRRFTLDPNGSLEIRDCYEFSAAPASLEEAFVTFEKVELSEDRQVVTIGGTSRLSALQPGVFSVEAFGPEAHEGRDPREFYRISFVPQALEATMALVFALAI